MMNCADKHPWEIDVAVLCIFFVRDDCFSQSFEAVRQARPSKLLLWQDGPRNEKDMEGIEKCRKIAENIDWDCEVYRCYNEKNYGCDPSTFYSHKWAFSIVDKCIILEDDLVPSPSFFKFCKELLDKYENDERIDRICGTNLLDEYNIEDDYFFSRWGNSWGWASWSRVAKKWEENYEFMDNEYAVSRMRELVPAKDLKGHLEWEKTCLLHKKEGIPYWEFLIGAEALLNNRLIIYPRVNMVENIGLDKNSTHAPENIEILSKTKQRFFTRKAYDLQFPLKHPKYIIEDRVFPQLCKESLHVPFNEKLESAIKKIKSRIIK